MLVLTQCGATKRESPGHVGRRRRARGWRRVGRGRVCRAGASSQVQTNEQAIDPEDHATLDALNGQTEAGGGGRTLADLIFSKMEGGAATQGIDDEEEGEHGSFHPLTRLWPSRSSQRPESQSYRGVHKVSQPPPPGSPTRVGYLLSRYKSGPLPKALKILPSLPHWAQLLALTEPTRWTPHATYACTKIFVSNLKPSEARVFMEGVLLGKCRDNMHDNQGKLNVHLYEALKKALYKPAAFFKGILFPLCEVGFGRAQERVLTRAVVVLVKGSRSGSVGALESVDPRVALCRRSASSRANGLYR